jgi:hypothetical protein
VYESTTTGAITSMTTVLWRFRDLQAHGIVDSWPQLRRLQVEYGFPLGRLISPNPTWPIGKKK